MAPEEACSSDMVVLIKWQGRTMAMSRCPVSTAGRQGKQSHRRSHRGLALLGRLALLFLTPESSHRLQPGLSARTGVEKALQLSGHIEAGVQLRESPVSVIRDVSPSVGEGQVRRANRAMLSRIWSALRVHTKVLGFSLCTSMKSRIGRFNASKSASSNALVGDLGKPALHQVDSRGVGGR